MKYAACQFGHVTKIGLVSAEYARQAARPRRPMLRGSGLIAVRYEPIEYTAGSRTPKHREDWA